jgi:hypothetical protein
MVQRVRIGIGDGTPLRVLDSSGVESKISSLFDANYRIMRGPLMRGSVGLFGVSNTFVPFGQTFAKPPYFQILWYQPVTGGFRYLYPTTTRSGTGTANGASGETGVSGLTLWHWTGSASTTIYYVVLKNLAQ